MATVSERLAIIVTANGGQAISELNRIGTTAKTQLGQAETSMQRVSTQMVQMGAAAVAGGAVVATGLWQAVQASADLGEAANKASVLFGDSYGTIEQFAKGAADGIGQSQRAALDATSTFAQFGQAAGLQGPALAKFSTELTTLASDLASFNNTTPEDAVLALGAALRGENEPIRRYGVLLDEATLKAEALAQGLTTDLSATLTPQQKALAAYEQILKQTTNAQGDYARTADSLPNRLRATTAAWEDLKASVGEGALPAFENLVKLGQGMLDKFEALPEQVKATVGQIVTLGTAATITAGGVSVLTGSLLRLQAAQAATDTGFATRLAGAAGPLAALAAAALAGFELQQKVNEEFAASVDKAVVSQDRFARSLPTNDLADLEKAASDAIEAASEPPDPSGWQRFQDVIRNTGLQMGGLGSVLGTLSVFDDKNRDQQFQVEAFNQSVENFKATLVGLDPETARARIEAFIRGLEGGIVPTQELARLQQILIKEFAGTGAAAQSAAAGMQAVIGAAQGAGDAIRDTADAADSLKSANDRVAAAQKRLADATKRDGKAIESAYERVVAAKERLDEILAGDGNNLEQESPQAQEARARAKLQEASFRLAANPNDALAQADKAEALQSITDAQQRGQDLLRNAQDIARQTRDAKRDLEDAQQSYNETLVGNPEEVQAARDELAQAERDRKLLIDDLNVAYREGKISIEAYKAELDRQVEMGIISPESAQILKMQADDLANQVGLAAAASGTLAVVTGEITTNLQTAAAAANAAVTGIPTLIARTLDAVTSALGYGEDTPPGALYGASRSVDLAGDRARQRARALAGRASGGPIAAGQGYLVGENGPELIVPGSSGYVLNADRTKNLTDGGATTWNVTNNITATEPKRAAAETVRKMKARKYLMAGS